MSKPTLLCVDDENVVLTGLKAQLKRSLGMEYSIETAESGEEGLEFLEELLHDKVEIPVVISDQIMPGMKGDEFLEKIYKISPRTLTILLTGQATASAVGNAVNNANLYRYIAKPWDESDLNLTVNEAIRSFFQEKKLEEQKIALEDAVQQLKEYNEKLEDKVQERTLEVTKQKEELEEKNKEITSSLSYASTIQQAVLPPLDSVQKFLPDSFFFYRPRDIVSGDFYWFTEINSKTFPGLTNENKFIIAAADCTGHGVPGAFMSLIGTTILNDLILTQRIFDTNIILDLLNTRIQKVLKQDQSANQDGMDIALCMIDKNAMICDFSGARNPLFYSLDGQMIQVKADLNTIGGLKRMTDANYTKTTINIKSDTSFYIFTDGFPDQIGGPNNRKFMRQNFKDILLKISHLPMIDQFIEVEKTFENWKQDYMQVDDVLVIGFRI